MKKILIVLFIIFNVQIHAQDISVEWLKNAGGTGFDAIYNMQQDSEENIIITGVFSGDAAFEDQKISSSENGGIYTAKYSSEGDLIWVNSFQSDGEITSETLCLNSENEIYICGSFKKNLTLGSYTFQAVDFSDNYIAKLDQKGDVVWAKHIITDTKGRNTRIACDNDGNVYYTGTFCKNVDFSEKKISVESGYDIFLAKYSSKGEFIDAVSITGFKAEEVNDLVTGNNGNVYLTGSFTEELKAENKTLRSYGKTDVFLAKFNDLNLDWAKQYGGFHKDYGERILVKNGRIYMTGCFSGKARFDDYELYSNGALDAFISAHDTNGNLLWVNSFGGLSNDYVSSLNINNKNSIYITGSYRGQLGTFEGGIQSENYSSDVFSAKFTSDGEFIKAYSFGGEGHDFASDILIDSENYIYQSVNFDENFTVKEDNKTSGNERDILITKYYDCDAAVKLYLGEDVEIYADNYTIIPNKPYPVYEWNNGSTESELTVYRSGEYSLKVVDENGCPFEDTISVYLYDELTEELLNGSAENVSNENKNSDFISNPVSFSLYPNPTKDNFFINLQNLNTKEKLQIRITDENGRVVYTDERTLFTDAVVREINLSNTSAGIYHIAVKNGEFTNTKRLIVSK